MFGLVVGYDGVGDEDAVDAVDSFDEAWPFWMPL